MKKYLYLLIFSLFLIFPLTASAKNVGINYDANDRFNYFYEQKNNTPFYQFLLSKGKNNLFTFLNSLTTLNQNYSTFDLTIYKVSELEDLGALNIPSNAEYVILTKASSNSSNRLVFDFTANIYKFYYAQQISEYSPIEYIPGFPTYNSKIFFFDSNSNYIPGTSFSSSSYNLPSYIDIEYEIENTSVSSMSNFSYFISKFYLSNDILKDKTIDSVENLVLTDLYLNNTRYLIDDNANYSSFLIWVRTFFTSAETYSVVNTNLEYFKKYKVYDINSNGIKDLFTMLNPTISVSVPNNYVSGVISSDSSFLIPKTTDSTSNTNVYISSSGFPKFMIDYYEFSIDENNNTNIVWTGLENRVAPSITKSDVIIPFNLLPDKEKTPLTYSDYMYQIGYYGSDSMYSSPVKYELTIYYNPAIYDLVDFDSVNGITGNLPGTSTPFTLSSDTITSKNLSGSSQNIGLVDYGSGSLSDYTNWLDEVSVVPDGSGTITSVSNLSKVMNFINSFTTIISTIFSLVMSLFTSLPPEVQSLFYFVFFGGVVIIIYKLIRGA